MNRKQKSGFSHKESRSTSKHGAGSPPHHSWIYGAHKTGSSPGSESSRGCVFPRTLPQWPYRIAPCSSALPYSGGTASALDRIPY